ncbi:MAG: hypothetical protein IH965_10920 [Gemmatimonadetes bacterium]|nr:hypothetical protein [Gemmatimonadota bacterium]
MDERTIKLRFVGSIVRSTSGHGESDEDEEVLNDVLHWIWSWRLQLRRFRETTATQGQAETDVDRRRSYSAASYDEHIVAVVGWNLIRAIDRAADRFPIFEITGDTAEQLRLLRHLYEHWDEQRSSFRSPSSPKTGSGKRFTELFPEGHPWSITYDGDDWLLGGVVALNSLTRELHNLEANALQLEQRRRSFDDE